MQNFKNKNWFSDDLLKTNKNNNYYYDFGTGKKIEREEVKKERDDFLEGFKFPETVIEREKEKETDPFVFGEPEITYLPYTPEKEVEPIKLPGNPKASFTITNYEDAKPKNSWYSYLGGDLSSDRDKETFLDGFTSQNESLVERTMREMSAKNAEAEQNKWMRAVDTISRASRAYEDFQDKISPFVPKVPLFPSSAPLRFVANLAIPALKKVHYSRNEKNVPVPKTIDEAKAMGWQKERLDYCHNFDTPNISNVKYVSSDGSGEQIFDSSRNPVTSPENMPTYNLFHPSKEKFMHSLADVAPWVLWGNSPDDSTAMLERIVVPLVLQYYEENVLPRISDSSGVSGG